MNFINQSIIVQKFCDDDTVLYCSSFPSLSELFQTRDGSSSGSVAYRNRYENIFRSHSQLIVTVKSPSSSSLSTVNVNVLVKMSQVIVVAVALAVATVSRSVGQRTVRTRTATIPTATATATATAIAAEEEGDDDDDEEGDDDDVGRCHKTMIREKGIKWTEISC